MLHAVHHPADFKMQYFLFFSFAYSWLELDSLSLRSEGLSDITEEGCLFCWLLASPCPIQVQVLVLTLPPHHGHGSQVWCHSSGLACPQVSCIDLNALGWRSGNQWGTGQVIENLGTCSTPTTATESSVDFSGRCVFSAVFKTIYDFSQ